MAPIIRELSKSMINKIAAGEVVERPANIVKELVENSIDAGATRITIEVERGGCDSIKITDDGCGIPADQLVLALSPHSTSKLSEPDDLFRIHTLGFRGEALASIAEITHLTLSSRSSESAEGAQIRCDGGVRTEIQPIGRAVGTTIETRDIFFNVPARRKFLKSPQAEFGHIQEAVTRIAIPNPNIGFVLKHNGRIVYDLPPNEGTLDRLRRIFKESVASRLVHVETSYKDVVVEGFVGKPELYKSTTTMQYLFLNKRYIQDKSLSHAVKEAYRGLIVDGQTGRRHPVVFLNVHVPANFVDFNVHPTKMEVRFVDSQGIYAGLLHAIRDNFLRSDMFDRPNEEELNAAVDRSSAQLGKTPSTESAQIARKRPEQELVPDVSNEPAFAMDERLADSAKKRIDEMFSKSSKNAKAAPVDQARLDVADADEVLAEAARKDAGRRDPAPKAPSKPTGYVGAPINPFAGPADFRKFPPLSPEKPSVKASARESKPEEKDVEKAGSTPRPLEPRKTPPAPLKKEPSLLDRVAANNEGVLRPNAPLATQVARTSEGKPVVQMCRRYLVMEARDGIAIVDQHALHERILFERLKASLESGTLDVQRLLVPEVVDLSPVEKPLVMENRDLFEELGLNVEEFGGTSVVINSYPAILRELTATDVFTAVLGVFMQRKGKVERADLLDFALKQTACKAAIKAGDSLRPESTIRLIAEAEEEVNSHHCPHGRPSTLVFTCQEIDKLFKRQ
ncbi:MAG: DNA mismatch repair endonuclease MutL [Thermoguttaceae bacterium]|nr:DNA mismatch repair endonuclease MutL [Thermoguttaceae bacterium]